MRSAQGPRIENADATERDWMRESKPGERKMQRPSLDEPAVPSRPPAVPSRPPAVPSR